jgi:asparagine synthetase B (glutamine-hydrolysing)
MIGASPILEGILMCGVVGFWHKDGKEADKHVLENMVQRLAHRGPDDQGVWTNQSIGLGHTRLSILDLSKHGHQPFFTTDHSSVISFNGEIYNYLDLRQRLENEGVSFKPGFPSWTLANEHRWPPARIIPSPPPQQRLLFIF